MLERVHRCGWKQVMWCRLCLALKRSSPSELPGWSASCTTTHQRPPVDTDPPPPSLSLSLHLFLSLSLSLSLTLPVSIPPVPSPSPFLYSFRSHPLCPFC